MSLPPIFGLQAFFVLARVNILSAITHAFRVSTSAARFGSWPFRNDHGLIFGSKNQRVIFSPRSVHGSVHVGDSIPRSRSLTLVARGITADPP